MQHFLIQVFRSLICLAYLTEFLCSQPPEKKPTGWLDILRNDPRLKAAVSYKFAARPTPEELLGSIQKATGVSLSFAGQAEKGKLTFGTTQSHNVPAWKVMEILALKQVTDGKWEKAGDGYVLHGKPSENGLTLDPAETEKHKAAKKAFEEAVAKADAQRKDFVKRHPYGLDPKLQAKMELEKDDTLAGLLARLHAATELNFALADNLIHHQPDFRWHTPTKSTPCWVIMGMITKADLDDGRWEKTDDGYRLEGVSRALRPPPPRSFAWLWGAGSIALTLAAAGGAFVIYRRRGQKPAALPSKKSIPRTSPPSPKKKGTYTPRGGD